MRTLALAVLLSTLPLGCSGNPEEYSSDESDLVGGTAENRFQAVGYLADTSVPTKALCGATLIAPNVVVTAAHCVYRSRDKALFFGTGALGASTRYPVKAIAYHPEAHMEKQGAIDFVHALLLNDLAYLVLERSVPGVIPAKLQAEKPKAGSAVRLVGYGPGNDDRVIRKGVDGTLLFNVKLGSDTIAEVHPTRGAVCSRDGDEGHAAVVAGADGTPLLVGIYVGSVTQAFTDCRKYLQFLNGYETTYGHVDFYQAGIDAGARAAR